MTENQVEDGSESPFCAHGHGPPDDSVKVRLHEIDRDEDELLDLPENGIPIGLEHNGYATPPRKAFTLYALEKERTGIRPRNPCALRRNLYKQSGAIHRNLYKSIHECALPEDGIRCRDLHR